MHPWKCEDIKIITDHDISLPWHWLYKGMNEFHKHTKIVYGHLYAIQSTKKRFTKFPNKISLRKQRVFLGENTCFNHRYNSIYTKEILAITWLDEFAFCQGSRSNSGCYMFWFAVLRELVMAEVSPASLSDQWRWSPQYYNSANSSLSQSIYINHPSPFVSVHRALDCGNLCLAQTPPAGLTQSAGKLCQLPGLFNTWQHESALPHAQII